MGDRDRNPFVEGQLKREAIDWYFRMQEPNAAQYEAKFRRWLARGALHRAAYNRIANLYLTGEKVNWANVEAAKPDKATIRRIGFMLVSVGTSLAILVLIASRLFHPLMDTPDRELIRPAPAAIAQLVTRLGEIRTVRLRDGSRVTMDTDSLVTVDYRAARRLLRLEHGRARFDVAHEPRPFVVDAGDSEVVAHGTVFDVGLLERDRVRVQLLRGSVEVRRPARHGADIVWLRPGEGLSYPASPGRSKAERPAAAPVADWPAGLVDIGAGSLGQIVSIANRYSTTKIRLADDKMAAIPLAGTFCVTDPDRLAVSVSQLLGLRVSRAPGEIILSVPPK